jgi:hypothetical protein
VRGMRPGKGGIMRSVPERRFGGPSSVRYGAARAPTSKRDPSLCPDKHLSGLRSRMTNEGKSGAASSAPTKAGMRKQIPAVGQAGFEVGRATQMARKASGLAKGAET